ncbi:MAG: acyl-CoA dehydrogenase family protein [Rhizobium sp.]
MANPKPRVWAAVGVRPLYLNRLDDIVREIAGHAPRHDAEGSFPTEAIDLLHAAGILTATVQPEHGGIEFSIADLVRLVSTVGRGDASAALILLMNLQFHAGQGARRALASHLYERILSESLDRPTLVNALRAEPDLGSPARGGLPATKARYSREGWVICGRKMFSTGSTGLSYHLPWAVTDEAAPRVAEFLVPSSTPGISIVPTWDHLGLRGAQSHDVVYEDVLVPHDHIVGAEVITSETKQDARAVAPAVLLIQSLYLGVAKAAQEAFARFAHQRIPANLGRPIATTEHIRAAAGRIELAIVQAESLLNHFAERMDRGDETAFASVTTAKTLISASLISAVETALKTLGNPGLSRNNPIERHFRDVLCSRIHSPQEDSVLLSVGAQSLSGYAPNT